MELRVSQCELRTYLVAPGVLRLRDRDRRLRFVLGSIQVARPSNALASLGADPAYDHAIGAAGCGEQRLLQHRDGFIPRGS